MLASELTTSDQVCLSFKVASSDLTATLHNLASGGIEFRASSTLGSSEVVIEILISFALYFLRGAKV